MSAAHFTLIQAATRKAGVTLPTSLTDRLAHLAAVAEVGLGTDRIITTVQLVTATTKALDAGRDPFTDKAVAAALARHQLAATAGWEQYLAAWREEQTTAALAEHADRLLNEWAALIGRAGADLAKALTHLDKTPTLEDQAATALRAGGERGEAWRTAARALEVIDNLCNAWQYLATMALKLAGWNADRGSTLLRNPNLTNAQLAKIGNHVGTWELATMHGVMITGATLADYREAVARVGQESQSAAENDFNAQAHAVWADSNRIK